MTAGLCFPLEVMVLRLAFDGAGTTAASAGVLNWVAPAARWMCEQTRAAVLGGARKESGGRFVHDEQFLSRLDARDRGQP